MSKIKKIKQNFKEINKHYYFFISNSYQVEITDTIKMSLATHL